MATVTKTIRKPAAQLRLPIIPENGDTPAVDKKDAVFNDPNFSSNKTLPVHRWVPWIAGFSSGFVKSALDGFLRKKGTVLDTFCGVGTTLVESILGGHNAIGFEINPYAALASRVKANAYHIDIDEFTSVIDDFRQFYKKMTSSKYKPYSAPPQGFKTRALFYNPLVLHKVLIVQDFVLAIEDDTLRDLFRLAFASTMVSYSNYSYEPSLGRRVSAGREEIHDFPVAKAITDKLADMAEDIAWMQEQMTPNNLKVQIINDSFFNCRQHLPTESVDLVITSPPYLNNYHYNRNTRPQLYWLGYAQSPEDLKKLEDMNFGKFWQTVRDCERLDLSFALSHTGIQERLQTLRNLNKEKGSYGGNGWANYAAAYFNDCHRFAEGIHYVLKRGGTALVVIGNSILQGVMIPTDEYFGKIAESVGLELVKIDIPRATRVGNSIIQSDVRVAKAKSSHQLYEAVVVLRKP
ncbi:MAG: site-specific DNA-methyltransferase [Nitrospiraceae bacterium]|nr:MAG: site-specific DNA-methyltransferase [Nitrospiraceae bacterium]